MNLQRTVQEIRAEIYGLSINFNQKKKDTLLENLSHQGFPMDKLQQIDPIIERLCSHSQIHITSTPSFLAFEIDDNMKLQQRVLNAATHAVASYGGFVNRVIDEVTTNPHKHYFIFSIAEGTYPDSTTITKLVRYTTWTSKNIIVSDTEEKETKDQSSFL